MLTRYQNVVPAQFLVQKMIDGIQVSNALTIDMAKARVLDNLLVHWLGSVSYMSDKVEIQFPQRSRGRIMRKGYCRISKFDSKRGCGGGIGRGRGRECGGCGGYPSGSNRHDPANGWFHGVDCSNFRSRFTGKAFYKAGSDACMYVFNKRKSDKDTHHIQKVHQGGKDDEKELALMPYSEVATCNNNSGGNENSN